MYSSIDIRYIAREIPVKEWKDSQNQLVSFEIKECMGLAVQQVNKQLKEGDTHTQQRSLGRE